LKHLKFEQPGQFIAGGLYAHRFMVPREKSKEIYLNQATKPSTYFRRTIGQSQAVHAWRGK
jgi:hypothetical protein